MIKFLLYPLYPDVLMVVSEQYMRVNETITSNIGRVLVLQCLIDG